MITLKPIDKENYRESLKLGVREDQNNFVAKNVMSLAQAWVNYGEAYPFAIYNDETMVGFLMLGYSQTDTVCDLWRFMIDERHQGKGNGKGALAAVLAYIKSLNRFERVSLSFEPENKTAEALYKSFDFEPTGEIDGGEIVMNLIIQP